MENKSYPTTHRNEQLKNMFIDIGFTVKLIGDRNQPKIIMDDDFVISGFVQNRLYHFTSKPFGGEIVRTVNLNDSDLTRNELIEILENNKQRKFYRLLHEDGSFYLRTERSLAIFSKTDSRYFFDKDKIILNKKKLNKLKIKVSIVESKNKNTE